ncbi:jg71, partial [Pararge aegeria aegeria]
VKNATLGRVHKSEDFTKQEEVHEYHEIPDTRTESSPAEMGAECLPESPGIKGCTDFSQSLLDEMETIFRSMDDRQDED